MLIHFRCGSCGATMAARSEYHGRTLPCPICRQPTAVPPPPEIPVAEVSRPDDALVSQLHPIAIQQLDEDARRIAWMEAREVGGSRTVGIILVALGCTPVAFGSAALAAGSMFGVPFTAVAASVAFGALSAAIGLAVVRLASENMQSEFRRRLPLVAERLRSDYWRRLQSQQSQQPPTQAARVLGAGAGGRG